jgi:pyruvate dehydrogenase E2 component (dihydrolipoamide acetyltransferase)
VAGKCQLSKDNRKMAVDFKLPDLGENVESGDVISLLVAEGDVIGANQNVVELETDKAVVEIPCPFAGKVTKFHVKPGDTVKIGQKILSVEQTAAVKPAESAPKGAAPEKAASGAASVAEKTASGGAKSEKAAEPAKVSSREASVAAKSQHAAQDDLETDDDSDEVSAAPSRSSASKATTNGGGEPPIGTKRDGSLPAAAGPATRRLARELGVDLARVVGSGPGGRITRDDIVAAVRNSASVLKTSPGRAAGEGKQESDQYGPIRRQQLTRIRETIATNMARSSATIPHVTNFDDVDITELERIRQGNMSSVVGSEHKLTMLPFVMKAVAQSLRQHQTLNASLDLEGREVIYKDYVNIGVAVDTERGLVVPVIREVDQLTIPQISQALAEIAERARSGKFGLEELRGGSFTVSNLGAVGGTYSTPIINPPEVAILLVGRSRLLPMVVGDKIEPRLMLPLSLSYDHRLVDGAVAARFLNEVKQYLTVPGRLLLAT